MVLVFRRLLFLFSDFAFTPALVQRRHLTDKDRSTAFWSSLILGAFATIIGIGIAGWVAAFFGEPSVKPLYIVFSFGFFVLAFGSTQAALLTRELAYRSLELRNIVGTVVGTAVAIALAWRGYGAWAIIGQMLATMTVSTLLVWQLSAWRPAFTFSRTSLRGLAGFSSQVLGTQIVTAVISNLDNLLVGKFLGATALGAYRLSYNLVIFPLSNLAVPIAQVLFPAFSRMQGDRTRMANAWIRATRVVLAVMCPIFIVLLVGAPTLVPVILGSRWDAAIPVIQILSWLGMLQSLRGLNAAVLQACGQPGTLLRIALLGLPIYAAGFVAGLEWGITGVAAGAAAAATIIQPLYTIAAARAVEIEARRVVFGERKGHRPGFDRASADVRNSRAARDRGRRADPSACRHRGVRGHDLRGRPLARRAGRSRRGQVAARAEKASSRQDGGMTARVRCCRSRRAPWELKALVIDEAERRRLRSATLSPSARGGRVGTRSPCAPPGSAGRRHSRVSTKSVTACRRMRPRGWRPQWVASSSVGDVQGTGPRRAGMSLSRNPTRPPVRRSRKLPLRGESTSRKFFAAGLVP